MQDQQQNTPGQIGPIEDGPSVRRVRIQRSLQASAHWIFPVAVETMS